MVAAVNQFVDACVQYTVEYQSANEEIIRMSGLKTTNLGDWAWCPLDAPVNGTCTRNEAFTFLNWFDANTAGDCMGVYRNANNVARWQQFGCEPKRAMCRIDCSNYN